MSERSSYVLQTVGDELSTDKNSRFVLRRGTSTIGRAFERDLVVSSAFAGREHCSISIDNGRIFITDHNSFNGTFVNCVRIKEDRHELHIGDIIGIGCSGHYESYQDKDQFSYFRLQKVSDQPAEVVDLSVDDNVEDDIICIASDDEEIQAEALSEIPVDRLPVRSPDEQKLYESRQQEQEEAIRSPDVESDDDEHTEESIQQLKILQQQAEDEAIPDNESIQNMQGHMWQSFAREFKQERQDLDEYMDDIVIESIEDGENDDCVLVEEPKEPVYIEKPDNEGENSLLQGWLTLLFKNSKQTPSKKRKGHEAEAPAVKKSKSHSNQGVPTHDEEAEVVIVPKQTKTDPKVPKTVSPISETVPEKSITLLNEIKPCHVVIKPYPQVDDWYVAKTTLSPGSSSSGSNSDGQNDSPVKSAKILLRRKSLLIPTDPIPERKSSKSDQIHRERDLRKSKDKHSLFHRYEEERKRKIERRQSVDPVRHSIENDKDRRGPETKPTTSQPKHQVPKDDQPDPISEMDLCNGSPPPTKSLVDTIHKINQNQPTANPMPISKRRHSICAQLIEARPLMKRRQSISTRNPDTTDKKLAKSLKQTQKIVRNESYKGSSIGKPIKKKRDEEQQKCRKEKLKTLALVPKVLEEIVVRVQCKPKVKLTINNRGSFLTDDSSLPPKPSTLKKKSAPAQQPKTTNPVLADIAVENQLESTIQKAIDRQPVVVNTASFLERERVHDFNIAKETLKKRALNAKTMNVINEVCANTSKFLLLQKNTITDFIRPAPPSVPAPRTQPPPEEDMFSSHTSSSDAGDSNYGDFSQTRMLEDESNEPQLSDYKLIMTRPAVALKSILAPLYQRKPKRCIRFDETQNRIKEYDVSKSIVEENQKSNYQNNPMHDIFTAITSWQPAWLSESTTDSRLMVINGTNAPCAPFVQTNFKSMAEYVMTLVPIMKIELWASIVNENRENRKRDATRVSVNAFFLEPRGRSMRYVFHCQVDLKSNVEIKLHDFVVVWFDDGQGTKPFFALVTSFRITSTTASPAAFFEMEAAQVPANANIPANTNAMNVSLVANIKYDLNLFRAVLQLHKSPLVEHILSPKNALLPPDAVQEAYFTYKGFDPLNRDQEEVIRSICHRFDSGKPNVTLVNGPPGTGKSRLIANLCMQMIYGNRSGRPAKMLVCASSNSATDAICRKLMRVLTDKRFTSQPFSMVRFGMLDKIHKEVRPHSVIELSKIVDLQEERGKLKLKISARELKSSASATPEYELVQLKSRLSILEMAIRKTKENPSNSKASYSYLLSKADIICTTLGSCSSLMNHMNAVDICIVDEATAFNEPITLLPLLLGVRTLVLVGDTFQHPVDFQSQNARVLGLGKSLFDRLQHSFDTKKPGPVFQLRMQYRMDPDICFWPSQYFYDRTLVSYPKMSNASFSLKPFTALNIECLGQQKSIENHDEIEFVARLLHVVARNVSLDHYSVGVISTNTLSRPDLMSKFNHPQFRRILVDTVDTYLGVEKDIIIVSILRPRGVGFMKLMDRLNIAMTRARKCLIVCGDFQSLMSHSMWHSMLASAKTRGLYYQFPFDQNRVVFEDNLSAVLLKRIPFVMPALANK